MRSAASARNAAVVLSVVAIYVRHIYSFDLQIQSQKEISKAKYSKNLRVNTVPSNEQRVCSFTHV